MFNLEDVVSKLVQLKRITDGELWWSSQTPEAIVAIPIFLCFSYFSAHPFRKFDPSRFNNLKIQNFRTPIWGGFSKRDTIDFRRAPGLLDK